MIDPFHDWRNPAKPVRWAGGFHNLPHAKEADEWITAYQDGLLTLSELIHNLDNAYVKGYLAGNEDAHFSVPAIHYEVVPMVIDGECIAIDILDIRDDGPWPVVYSFDKY